MSVVVSLLRAIDRADGEALVMHVGEKPYVVTASGHAELAASALTVPAMTGMLDQLLPADSRQALNELGAVEYHLPADQCAPGTRYSVVAARGGDDIWIEVRRRREIEEPPPAAVPRAAAPRVAVPQAAVVPEAPPSAVQEAPPASAMEDYEPRLIEEPEPVAMAEPDLAAFEGPELSLVEEPAPVVFEPPEPAAEPEPPLNHFITPPRREEIPQPHEEPPPADVPEPIEQPGDRFELRRPAEEDFSVDAVEDLDEEPRHLDEPPAPALDFTIEPEPMPVAAVVVPMARVNVRLETPSTPPVASQPAAPPIHPLHHLLSVAAAQGASALYVAPQARPSLRIDGEMRVLDDAPITDAQLEAELRTLVPAGSQGAALPLGEFETRELPGVGRVQVLLFRDHRGLGAIFRMLPGRTVSAEQAGLSPGIQTLCTEPEGLLLVAGSHGAGKSTLVAALVDQINRTRRDHVITVESDIQFVHENRTSFVSQREAREDTQFLDAVRSAIREAPDVLVIDGVMSSEVASFALQAAAEGLVVASVPAPTTAAALERFIGLFGSEAANGRTMVSEHLRGVVTQALLRKTGGGRVAAREVLINVPSVASLVANAQFDQLAGVLTSGRRIGMVPLNDALIGLVQSGALDVRQAYRKSTDQAELLNMLSKAGFDTTFAEKLA